MKKLLSLLLILVLLPLAGCSENTDTGKIQIVATLFPQYDFARQIGGDKVDVTLLLPPGTDSHHFDPSPSDMVKISESDLFVYTGDVMEGWAGDIAASLSGDATVLNVSENIALSEHGHDDGHDHAIDPHIWLDFDNAMAMCVNIANTLCHISPENADYFKANLNSFINSLNELDNSYQAVFANTPSKELIFGGRFALGYLVEKYQIPHKSAYESCNANDEPSVQVIASLCDYVKEHDVKVVYCEEFSDAKVAKEIASANNAEVLTLHSAHNTSREEREAGVTFISIMEQNLENIRKGLN